MDIDFITEAERKRMIAAGYASTKHISLACAYVTPQHLEQAIEPLTFSFFEDHCDERAAIDFSQIPTLHRVTLYRALENADEVQGIGFGFPGMRGPGEHKDQIVPINGCALLQLARHLLSKVPAHAFPKGEIDTKFSIDLGL
ncbi:MULTISPECIES: hypothetical protein [Pseudomonas]|uniref:Uncharacterized protein n=3 Tax=Pseudomonas savastanoi TaxID=29438 RepID=A0AAW5J9P7_PSESS|nr:MULTISPECIES: hypothetical protein [Pseudomonas]ARD13769.1 hypothetical protein PSA3335_23615 [Pseudomonas savastanoi pv. savastanoi NCPPB 3335]MBA4702759.1 hypothetical protein [Pseudomonas savastanoi pv. savastanoi]MCQ3023738.1 hypothetical protein [Pseudomonas savastanoi]TSC36235.1 hypothetical protein FOM00_14880 [Pseudomonas sp. ST1]UKL10771.1 hypothetical protein HQ966_04830 [Pseudomonas savastanoi pv. savastanoi]